LRVMRMAALYNCRAYCMASCSKLAWSAMSRDGTGSG
jgi:hypothetical protein